MSSRPSPVPVPRAADPFPAAGISRDDRGISHYDGLPASLLDMLSRYAERAPGAEAVVELGGRRLSYHELWDASRRVAGGLLDRGLARGDRVAVRYPAGIDWVLAFWGTLMAGGVPVAVNTRLAKPETEFVLSDSGATVDLAPGTVLPDGDPQPLPKLSARDVAGLFYTSGTTGKPKGVPATHEAFLTNAENMVRGLGLPPGAGPSLRTLISVPLFHVTGCNSQLLTAAYVGGTSIILPALDLPALAAALAEEQISFLVTVPAVYALLLRHPEFAAADVSPVRWVGYGGAPIAPALVRALKAAFPAAAVFNGYGMTETASLMTVLPETDAVEHADSVGYAVPVVDLAVDPISTDPRVGELLARGANVMTGYWNRPAESARAFAGGWLRTGDVVRVDDAGRVHLIDRLKDIIIRGGENVSSVEVEDALATAPGVAEAAVIGVPDEVMGEKVGAVLVGLGDDINVPAVLAHCQERLADYKIPQYVSVVGGPLPRNAGGKLLKSRLRTEVRWGPPLR